MDMRGSLGHLLRSFPRSYPHEALAHQHGPRHFFGEGDVFLCWFCFGRIPARMVLFGPPLSALTSPLVFGPYVGCSALVLIQPGMTIPGLALRFAFAPVGRGGQTSLPLPHPPASVIPRSSRIAEIPIEVSCRTFDLKQPRF